MHADATNAADEGTREHPRWWLLAFVLTVILLSAFCVFVLPFYFPPHLPVRSEAYAAGFSNKVAEIATGLLSVAVALFCLRFGRAARLQPQTTLGRGWMFAGMAAGAGLSLALGLVAIRAGVYFGESQYFLTQVEQGLRLHRTLYREVQFAYGPALYWWPALLAKAGLPMMTAYVIALATMQAAGFALLFYVVDALPVPVAMKRFAYAVLAVGSLSPSLGLNYSLFRFTLPMAAMVLLGRSSRWTVVAAGVAVMAGLAVSAEAGVACLGGAIAVAVYRRSAPALAGAAAGLGLSILVLGKDYFQTLLEAGNGGFDLLLTPEPRTLLLLVAAIGLAPLAVARGVLAARQDAGRQPVAGILVALYGAALGSLPVALGRCDAGHEFFFAMGCVLLSLVAVGSAASVSAKVWLACVLGLVVMTQRAYLSLYRNPLDQLRRQANGELAGDGIDVDALAHALAGHPVMPLDGIPWRVNEALMARGLIAPAFYCQLSGVWSEADERRKIADMRQSGYALDLGEGMSDPRDFDPPARWHGLLPYRQRQEPFEPGLLLDREMNANWVAVSRYGRYALLRKIR